jgi:hypothetical protein
LDFGFAILDWSRSSSAYPEALRGQSKIQNRKSKIDRPLAREMPPDIMGCLMRRELFSEALEGRLRLWNILVQKASRTSDERDETL